MKSNGTIDPTTGEVKLSEIGKQRFWSRINKDGQIPNHRPELGKCWEWTAGKNTEGYGYFSFGYQSLRCHRIAWMLRNGVIPKSLQINHRCDNPSCCRLDHLWIGTSKENTHDMLNKGRQNNTQGCWPDDPRTRVGADCHSAKFTDEQVIEIRARRKNGEKQCDLAIEFGVRRNAIANIVHGKSWKHLL